MPTRSFEEILTAIKSSVSNLDTREGSYFDTQIRAVAMEIAQAYFDLDAVVPIAFVDETSGGYIDMRAGEYGIVRKPGTYAKATVTFAGSEGKLIPDATAVQTQGGLLFYTDEPAVIVSGAAIVPVTAADVGAVYNVPENAITALQSGAGVTVTASAAAVGGTDPETDEALLDRLLERLQRPPTSGNAYQYRQWALEVGGIGGAKVYELWNGPGTVKVVVADANMQPPTTQLVQDVAAHIAQLRPVCANVTVQAAEELTIQVAATVITDESVTLEGVKERLTQLLVDYCREVAFESLTVVYNRIAYMLLSIPGVEDFTSLTLNGGVVNLTLADNAVPVVGEVTVV